MSIHHSRMCMGLVHSYESPQGPRHKHMPHKSYLHIQRYTIIYDTQSRSLQSHSHQQILNIVSSFAVNCPWVLLGGPTHLYGCVLVTL